MKFKSSKAWEPVQKLAEEYHSLVQQGYGTNLENRSPKQIEIANEIISKSQRFLKSIAAELYFRGRRIRISGGKTVTLRINTNCFKLDDLVQEASLGIVGGLHKYDSSKYRISSFMAYRATVHISKVVKNLGFLVRIESNRFDWSISAFDRDDPDKSVEQIEKAIDFKYPAIPSLLTAQLIDTQFRNEIIDLSQLIEIDDTPIEPKDLYLFVNQLYSQIPQPTSEDPSLPKEESNPEEETFTLEVMARIRTAISQLEPKRKRAIDLRYGIEELRENPLTFLEIGSLMGYRSGPKRPPQLEADALSKLRRKQILKDLI